MQVRVEEDVHFKIRKYAEFIDGSPEDVVAEALKLLLDKDDEFLGAGGRHSERLQSVSR